jgi:HTH domain
MLVNPCLRRSGVEAKDLARELGVTVRQLRRDRALLERFGFPLESVIGDDGVHRLLFVPLPQCRAALPAAKERSASSAQ